MTGMCLLSGKGDYTTNEGYRKTVKRKIAVMSLIIILGLVSIAAIELCKHIFNIPITDYTEGLYLGIGTGLVACGTILIIKRKRILADEEKLKKARIAESDERNLAIANASWKTATIALLFAVYAEFLIAGISMPQVARAAESLIAIFFIVYLVAYRVNTSKM
ncbi:MAG: hypothetical protein KA965_11765 [Butyrivibrio sp.]|nr:hypothetical protein [Butyrivibrio sp.]